MRLIVTQINGKIGNIQNSGIVDDMNNAISNRIEFMGYDHNTLNSPQKQGISGSGDGVALSYDSGLYGVQFGIARADSYPLIRIRENGSWKPWKNLALKSDLGGFLFEISTNINQYNSVISNTYRILCGVHDDRAYLSIDINWIRIQFRAYSDTMSPIQYRCIYGNNQPSNWTEL